LYFIAGSAIGIRSMASIQGAEMTDSRDEKMPPEFSSKVKRVPPNGSSSIYFVNETFDEDGGRVELWGSKSSASGADYTIKFTFSPENKLVSTRLTEGY
jgi:hypothetical protein